MATNRYWEGRIKVVCADMMCFPVSAKDLEPLACSSYDPYAWSDPDNAVETISHAEWMQRAWKIREAKP